jgi:hypothetical protein
MGHPFHQGRFSQVEKRTLPFSLRHNLNLSNEPYREDTYAS